MKKNMKKKALLTMSVVLLLLVAVGTTLAYIFTKTDPVVNTFKPSKVSCAVVENDSEPVAGAVMPIESTKERVQIKNTGDTDAYIRVAVMVNWMSKDGTRAWAEKPVEDTDYTIEWNINGWTREEDGYYYYNSVVSPGGLTGVLIKEAKLMDGVTPPTGTDGTAYHLSIEIVASAIQAKGMGANSAQAAWAKAQQQNG